VTGQPLSADELMPLACNLSVRPRPPSATSLPGLLALFQNEWDGLMLETHTLKK
jgi:pre-mRNA-processing factor 19